MREVRTFEYVCTASRHDPAFVEHHEHYTVAYVRRGTFGCTTRGRRYELAAGSLLCGHPGDEYTCTHDHHGGGDECLVFQLPVELVDELGTTESWRARAIPPLAEIVVLGELDEVSREEQGLAIASRFVKATGVARRAADPTPSDRKRAVAIARRIAEAPANDHDLASLARDAKLSTFHFLRVFKSVFGVTPHQFVVRSRLREAARLLSAGDLPVTDVALAVGFDDLSNFVRTFHRAAGVSPSRYRSKILQAG